MNHAFHVLVHALTLLFLLGVVGCLVAIPVVAVKFASVLFEKDTEAEASPDQPPPV